MTSHLVFAIGTLMSWAGWFFFAKAVVLTAAWLTGDQGVSRSLTISGLLALVGLGGGHALTQNLPAGSGTAAAGSAFKLPLVWPVMPFLGWLAAASLVLVLVRLAQIFLAASDTERTPKIKSLGIWLATGILALVLLRSDPSLKVDLLTGGIPISLVGAASILVLSVITVVAMVAGTHKAAARGVNKTFLTHVALVIGSIVFGIPLLYLLVTSFKEDRDMTGLSGVVWIPRVQETVPHRDPARPLYRTSFEGQEVTGSIIRDLPNDKVQVDIFTPYAIRGITFETTRTALKEISRDVPLVTVQWDGREVVGKVVEDLEDGSRRVEAIRPPEFEGKQKVFAPSDVIPIRNVGLRWQNYTESISYLPPETRGGLVYLRNTLLIVVFSVIGTILSSALAAYAFSRMRFPGRGALFAIVLSTMMLPGAVTLLPQFLIFRTLGWVDTLYPLWVPAFFGAAFNIFLLRQFFLTIPLELEDASKIDGCSYLRTFWDVMLPQIKPALAVIAIWTFMGAWNNFMGPLIYINSPENMPVAYAVQLYQSARSSEPGLLMAFATMAMVPVLLLFFFAQRYFIEGVTLSGFGGK